MSGNAIRVGVGVGGLAVAAVGTPAVMVAAGATVAVGLAGYGVYKLCSAESKPASRRGSMTRRGR